MKQDLVVDCSITMAWCFSDESSKTADTADKVLANLTRGATGHVPSLWPIEVSNILSVGERKKRISSAGVSYFLERLQKLPIETDISTGAFAFNNILNLSREHNLSSYDAAYLDLAMRKGIPLATQDKQLASVAQKVKVDLFS